MAKVEHKHAIIGFGGMGGWHYQNITERIDGLTVKGVFDVRQEACDQAKEKGLHVYESLDELLADPELDIVTIATPNNFHMDLAIRAMRAGKHVICEKPVTMNAGELEAILRVRNETGKLFSVHQNRRWDKDYCIIKKILADGTIGTPYYIESRVLGSRRSMHGWRGHKVNGGGMVYDWGIHLIDQAMNLIDSKVVSVDAHLFNIFSDGVDDNFKLLMRFENGISYLVEIATNCFINLPRWHMTCNDGTAIIDDWSCGGKMIKLNTDEEMAWDDEIVYTEAGPTRTMAPRPKQTTVELALPEVTTDWADYYKNIMDVIDNGAELLVKPEQSLRVMNVIDTIFKSAALGHGVECYI